MMSVLYIRLKRVVMGFFGLGIWQGEQKSERYKVRSSASGAGDAGPMTIVSKRKHKRIGSVHMTAIKERRRTVVNPVIRQRRVPVAVNVYEVNTIKHWLNTSRTMISGRLRPYVT